MDRATIELIAEMAAQRAIEKHEAANIGRLREFRAELHEAIDTKIQMHEAKCPVGFDFNKCKARLVGFAIGIAGGSSGITVLLSKLIGL